MRLNITKNLIIVNFGLFTNWLSKLLMKLLIFLVVKSLFWDSIVACITFKYLFDNHLRKIQCCFILVVLRQSVLTVEDCWLRLLFHFYSSNYRHSILITVCIVLTIFDVGLWLNTWKFWLFCSEMFFNLEKDLAAS